MNKHTSQCPPALASTSVSKRLWVAGALVLLAAGCASYKGIDSAARQKLPGDLAAADSLPSQGGRWPDQNWATRVGGAQLQALVDEGLTANPGLHAAAARLSAARAMAEGVGASARPTVGARFSDTYERFTENGLIPPPFAGGRYSDSELALDFSYEIDFWGKHSADLRAAISEQKAAQAEQYSARLMLTTAIARSWVQLARQYEQSDLVESQLAIGSKIEHLTQLRLAAGLDTQTDRQQSELRTAALRSEQAQWQEAIALTRNQLAALMGQGPDRGLSIARPALPPDETVATPNELPLELLGRRPDIVAARWRVEAATGGIEGAKARFYPNVNLSAFAGASSLGLNKLLQSGSQIGGIGPAIGMPIFDGGRLRAQLKQRVAAYDAAIAGYDQTLTDALRDVADQVRSLRAVDAQMENQRKATQAAAASLKLAQQRERAGTAGMLQVLAAESAWLSQRRLERDIQARRADLGIALIKALGGGFDAGVHNLDPAARDQQSSIFPSTPTIEESAT